MEMIIVKESDLRTYEYYLDGLKIVRVVNIQEGERYEMPFRKNRERKVFTDKKGKYIKLGDYKHYISE